MGPRGEGWVIGQFVIGALILGTTFVTQAAVPLIVRLVGAGLMLSGGTLALLGLIQLGANLTPFPKPREEGYLITSGVYALVRHPIYTGVALGAFGWTLWWGTGLGFVLAIVLFIWLDLKSQREEKWLVEKYSEYQEYQKRVKRLIPFLY